MKRILLVLFVLSLVLAVGGSRAAVAEEAELQADASVVISEIRIDQPDADNDEYFELAGPANMALDGLTYLVIGDGTGGSGVIEAVVDLAGHSIPASGHFVAAEGSFSLGTADLTGDLNFENSDNVTHLLVSGFSGANGDDLDTNDDGTLDATPWQDVTDLIALVEEENPPSSTEFHYGPPAIGPDGSFVPGHVLRCAGGWEIGAFDPIGGQDTPGAANSCGPVAPPVVINEIRIDQPSTDNDEYFELAGPAGAALDGLSYLVIGDGAAGSGVVEEVTDLGGYVIPASGYFVVAESTFALAGIDLITDLNFENSDNVTHLLVWNFSAADGDDLDTDDDGVLDVTPWESLVDLIALVEEENPPSGTEYHYGPPSVGPDGSFVPGHVFRCDYGWQIGAFDPAGGDDSPGKANSCPPPPAPTGLTINEIRIDQPGTDNDEFFELAGPANAALDGLTYLVIGDGSAGSGVVEAVIDLSGSYIPSSGYFVAAESTFTLGSANLVTDLNFENSDNVTHLLVWNFTGADGDDLDTNDDGALDATPWQEIVDLIALVEEENPPSGTEYHYGPPSIGPDGGFVPGHVFHCEDGWRIGAFGGGDETPGAENACEPVTPPTNVCGDPATFIHEIQGSGFATPLEGSTVTIEGVVVGDFQQGDGDDFSDLNGFFVQEEADDFDADPATSEGIFVYAPGAIDVSTGDIVRVAGTADEYFGLTQISDVSNVSFCDTGELPAPLVTTVTSEHEPVEGMLVQFEHLAISEYYNFDRYGEIRLCDPRPDENRLYQPTALADPGSDEAEAIAAYNATHCILLDDGRTGSAHENPDPARHPNGAEFTLDNRFRGGDVVTELTGVMSYGFNEYRIQPTRGAGYTSINERPAAPDDVGGKIQVASFNVLNYFTTLGSRGADTLEEFQRQQDKIVAALAAIDADVYGLMEIENNDEAGQNLVDALNAAVGPGTYEYIATGPIGTDEIKVAFLYKPATVSTVGDYAVLDDEAFTDPNNTGGAKNRPALVQTFMDDETGGVFTVVVNHLKSKGSGCGPGDDDPVQGNCNLTRTLAADYLVDWLATDPTGSGDQDYLIIGDLNAYDHEDPIYEIREGADDVPGTDDDYGDLLLQYEGETAYTYLFDGQFGYLDYALANQALLSEVTGATVWHINADEPDILDYDMTFKKDEQDALYEPNAYRSSDHDPVIVGLNVCDEIAPEASVTVSPDLLWPPNHKYVEVVATVAASDNFDPDPTVALVSVTSNEPDDGLGDGDTPMDIIIHDDYTFELRAERSALGEGRVYTITYQVTDDCGNSTVVSATVTVPLSQGAQDE